MRTSTASGSTYDVECRDGTTGDGAYLAVSANVNGKSIEELSNQFFQEQLFSPTGRFSFYGAPTDIKIKKSTTSGNYRSVKIGIQQECLPLATLLIPWPFLFCTCLIMSAIRTMDIDFSILSQSTGAEVSLMH